ncbi:MAG TPA: FAD-linked oxidase C-terminal domain-containing protein [Phenylobacterium sp.]|uniref:FAD-binding oxidoreductase n=1 Tax=Phenylobacterium sp. TaxID=1871053 RepID=UPI002B4879D0|nr:FAD-linked oxidase C-terminal domain-containing protein [Phenylobacterium sp.]HKR87076.1 FAD-linked oxidase C-terminal domain-containing protein [Phenylobacterium sp.]
MGDPNPLPTTLAAALHDRFGARFSTNAQVLLQHGRTESHHAVRLPDGVVLAHTTEEVRAVVRLCAEHRVPIVPFGAGTSMEGHTVPVRGGISLDLSEMNRIVAVNADDFDCTVEAGVRRQQLNDHLRDQGLFFPIDPGADATLGGMASTRASGTNAVRYGTMKDAVLSLRVVTPDGRVIRTSRRARKSAAGYDLTRLYVGAEGTLGVITEVTLRLHPIPETVSAAVCGFASLHGAVSTVVQTLQYGVPIARIELLDDVQMMAVNRWSKLDYAEVTTLFFEFHGSERSVQEQVETVAAIAAENGGGEFRWASSQEERSRLWKARHQAYYAALALRPGAVGWPTDVCVPISRLAECIEATKADLARASIPAPIVGHVGDGNFHVVFILDPDRPDERAEAERLNAALVERALSLDGTCTGEHGIGLGKIDCLEHELDEGALDVMRTIKRALDPQGIMNPGKIVRL